MAGQGRKAVGAGVLWRLLAAVALPTSALAGGYDTGERDWDFLFRQDNFAVEAQTRYIDPQRTLTGVLGTGVAIAGLTTASVREAAPFSVERLSLMVRPADSLRCLGSYRQPWEGHANYGTSWAAAAAATEQHFTSDDIGLTCALSVPLELGNLFFMGGASYQQIRYQLTQALGGGLFATSDVSDNGVGWRAGLGYEIAQYALRLSMIYNSAIDYAMTGTGAGLGGVYTGPIYGSLTMPQSWELKAQSGIAPGWLAFGAIKWTDWGVVQAMPLYIAGTTTQVSGLTLLWDDAWTVTLGAARQFSPAFSLASSLTWSQGASRGFTSQTDTWTADVTAILTPHKNMELKFGATVGLMTAGSLDTGLGGTNPVGYTASFGNDLVYALSASAALHY